MKWMTYILELRDGTYYTGITNNLAKRTDAHKNGRGSKYVKSRLPFRVVYTCYSKNRSEASKIEAKIKKLSRKNKELVVKGNYNIHENEIHFFCESCGAVISVKRDDLQFLSDTKDKKIAIRCVVCRNIITHEDK